MKASSLLFVTLALAACGSSGPATGGTSGGEVVPTTPTRDAEPSSTTHAAAERAGLAEAGVVGAPAGDPLLTAAPEEHGCVADGDCALTTFSSCCGDRYCESDARAVNGDWLRRQESNCAVVECSERDHEILACPTPPAFTAACDAGTCVRR